MRSKYCIIAIICIISLSCSDKADDLMAPVLTQTPADPGEYAVTLTSDNIPADGASFAEVVVKAGPTITSKYSEANVDVAPIGKLSTGASTAKVKLDANGEARIFLSSSTIGKSKVTVSVGNLSKSTSVGFVNAGPDNMIVEADLSTMRPVFESKAIVKAKLIRSTGTVSVNQLVQFYDSTGAGKSVGVFLNSTSSNAQGECSAEYRLVDTSFRGPVFLIGQVLGNGTNVGGKTRIQIQ